MPFRGPNKKQVLAVSSSAVGLAQTVGDDGVFPTAAMIVVETAPIRFQVDATNPTTTVGLPASIGAVIELHDRGEISKFLAIKSGATDASLDVQFYDQYEEY